MEKSDPPKSFGVFKPVGHTVIAFASDAAMQTAVSALLEQGFSASDLVRYTPREMEAQADADMLSASPLASVGQELNLVRSQRELAQNGCSFLVVHAPEDEQAERVAAVVRSMKATAAQRYGRFIIEDLTEQPWGETQVFESPDRGLDIDVAAQTPH